MSRRRKLIVPWKQGQLYIELKPDGTATASYSPDTGPLLRFETVAEMLEHHGLPADALPLTR